jgi:hypothetical protein
MMIRLMFTANRRWSGSRGRLHHGVEASDRDIVLGIGLVRIG